MRRIYNLPPATGEQKGLWMTAARLLRIGNFRQRGVGRGVGGGAGIVLRRKYSAISHLRRLRKFAVEARAAAELITPDPERDPLLQTAAKSKTMGNAAESVGGFRPALNFNRLSTSHFYR